MLFFGKLLQELIVDDDLGSKVKCLLFLRGRIGKEEIFFEVPVDLVSLNGERLIGDYEEFASLEQEGQDTSSW